MKIRKLENINDYKELEKYNFYLISKSDSEILAIYLGNIKFNSYYLELYFYRVIELEIIKKKNKSEVKDIIEQIFTKKLRETYLEIYGEIVEPQTIFKPSGILYTNGDKIYRCNISIEIDKERFNKWYTKNRLVQISLPILE